MIGEGVLARVLLALAIGLILLALYGVFNRVLLARLRGRRLGIEALRPGTPAILYFTAPSCMPCKTVQRPALERLQQSLGERLQVIEIDASARPDLADYWGVLSLPTTFIIDRHGRPRRINHGVASAEKLLGQLEEIDQERHLFATVCKAVRRAQERLS